MRKCTSALICLVLIGGFGLSALAAGPAQLTFEPISIELIDEMETDFWGMKLENGFVATLKVNAQQEGRIWTNDFALAYFDGENEYRYVCQAMTSPVSSLDDDGAWKYDPFGFTKIKKGTRYFKAFFPLQVMSLSMLEPANFEPGEQYDLYLLVNQFSAKPLSVTVPEVQSDYEDAEYYE